MTICPRSLVATDKRLRKSNDVLKRRSFKPETRVRISVEGIVRTPWSPHIAAMLSVAWGVLRGKAYS